MTVSMHWEEWALGNAIHVLQMQKVKWTHLPKPLGDIQESHDSGVRKVAWATGLFYPFYR